MLQALPQPLTPSQQRVEKPQSTMDTRQLDGLVQEISVAAQDKSTQVDIQLNSQTLQGLHIRIASDQGGSIAIQFTTASAAVSEFLSGNIQQLSNALAERDIKVSEIRVARRDSVSGALRQKNSGGRQRER